MQLTRAEEEIMKTLWTLGKAAVHEILPKLPRKCARTTVATILSILENKGFVKHEMIGRNNIYEPIIPRETYSKKQVSSMMDDYFNGSISSMLSFFIKEGGVSLEEADKLIKIANEIKDKQ